MNMSKFHLLYAALAGMLVLPLGIAAADDDETQVKEEKRVVVVSADGEVKEGEAIARFVTAEDDDDEHVQVFRISKDGKIVVVRGDGEGGEDVQVRVRPRIIRTGDSEGEIKVQVLGGDDDSPGEQRVMVWVDDEGNKRELSRQIRQRAIRTGDEENEDVRVIRLNVNDDEDDGESSPGDRVRRVRVRGVPQVIEKKIELELEFDEEANDHPQRIVRVLRGLQEDDDHEHGAHGQMIVELKALAEGLEGDHAEKIIELLQRHGHGDGELKIEAHIEKHGDHDDDGEHKRGRVIILRTSGDGDEEIDIQAIPLMLHGEHGAMLHLEGDHDKLHHRIMERLHGHEMRLQARPHMLMQRLHLHEDDDDDDDELAERLEELEERLEELEEKIEAMTRRRR